ncbi:hypothetical protein M121_4458 [Bacteroides fragilis str. 3783N2-1]|nr:hypothetical protein M121_4458 [Bacteroides fragilis str. 3783N2-1]
MAPDLIINEIPAEAEGRSISSAQELIQRLTKRNNKNARSNTLFLANEKFSM